MNKITEDRIFQLKSELYKLLEAADETELSETDADLLYTMSFDPELTEN